MSYKFWEVKLDDKGETYIEEIELEKVFRKPSLFQRIKYWINWMKMKVSK